ncbi:MAG TPA: SprT family zinc-dependent metalloprotease [Longimicrobiales bacterium]|nr:SprT family zinc-dependent metalloprotease [Longimicrobiales bacterium]
MARLTEVEVVAALRERGVLQVRRVGFRANRSTILSLSPGGGRLSLHVAFTEATPRILDALAVYLLEGPRRTSGFRRASRTIRTWRRLERAMAAELRRAGGRRGRRRRRIEKPAPGPCCATLAQRRYLEALYAHYNRTAFGGRLPADVCVRLSSRMTTRLGQVKLWRDRWGRRSVIELALNADLMLPENDRNRRDTLLHEMAHIEAWLAYGDGGHGDAWKHIARRVGCIDLACAGRGPRRRGRGQRPTDRVPGDVRRAA